MQYWIEIDGARDRLLSKEDLCSKYRHLPADTPCAKSGEKTWRKLTDYFPLPKRDKAFRLVSFFI